MKVLLLWVTAVLFSCAPIRSSAAASMSMWNAVPDQTQAAPPVTTETKDKKKSDKKHQPAEMPVCDTDTYSKCHKMKGVMPPRLIRSEDIEPAEADLQGSAGLAVVVDEKGMPQKVILVNPFFFPGHIVNLATEMNEKAVKAVRSYRFQPATLNGQAVPVLITISVNLNVVAEH
jgi:Gram-negative bacterial TonB protein C-terminal